MTPIPNRASPSAPLSQMVLIVEDDPLIRDLLCEILESEGFVTQGMANADRALEFLIDQSSRVCLLLTDINMHGTINGAELAKTSILLWPAIPIVVMSGVETPETVGLGQNLAFIRKPFTVEKILKVIQKALVSDE
jgi:DNA-binding NtrC family response regulator